MKQNHNSAEVLPSELTEIAKTGSRREKRLAVALLAAWDRSASTNLLLAEARHIIGHGVEYLSGPSELTNEEDTAAVDSFVQRARELMESDRQSGPFIDMIARIMCGLSLMVDGKPSGSYLREMARELSRLPAKDPAARGLAKMDLERVLKESVPRLTDLAGFDQRYMEAVPARNQPGPTATGGQNGADGTSSRDTSGDDPGVRSSDS